MKCLAILAAAGTLLLTGCATTIRSDVTVFHQWPAQLQEKSYVFGTPAPAEDTLEYRSYQNLVAAQLNRLGFAPAGSPAAARLRVDMSFSTTDRPTRQLQAMDPYWSMSPYWGPYGWPYRGFYPSRYRYRYHGFRPYYDPWMFGPAEFREVILHNYERKLNVQIADMAGAKLYDVTVQNTSRRQSTAQVMPLLVQSAFKEFPGESGKARQVELELEPRQQ